jgi:hypothetical protein
MTYAPEQLADLETRLSEATESSRELDRILAKIAGWHRVEPKHTNSIHGGWIAPEDFCGVRGGGAPILDSLHGTEIHRDPPAVTRSIDSALAFCEAVMPDMNCHGYDAGPKLIEAWISRNHCPDGHWYFNGYHKTSVPIAFCIAAVRALLGKKNRRVACSPG